MSDPIGMDQKVRSYKDAIARCSDPVGDFVNDRFGAFTMMFCGESDEDAKARAGETYPALPRTGPSPTPWGSRT